MMLNDLPWKQTEIILPFLRLNSILHFGGEGNGNPLQYSCLENSMDRGAWQAIVVGVAKKESNTTEQLSHTLHFGTSREFQKNIWFCFIDTTKAFNCVDLNKLWKILRDGNTQPPYLPPAKPVFRSRSNS